MTLTVEADDLRLALRRVKLVGPRGMCPVLLLDDGGDAIFSADSLDARVSLSIQTLAGGSDLRVLMPYGPVAEVTAKLPKGPVRIDVVDGMLRLRSARSTSKLFLLDPDTMPRRPALDPAHARVLDLTEVWDAVLRVVPAADDHGVGWVRDVFVHQGHAYATDKYRVHRTKLPEGLENEMLRLPGQLLQRVVAAKVAITELVWDANPSVDRGQFRLQSSDASWYGTLGQLDEVRRAAPVLSKPFSMEPVVSLSFDRAELRDCIGQAMALPVTEGGYREGVAFTFADDQVELSRMGADVGSTTIVLPCAVTGTVNRVGFNGPNLADSLARIEGDEVTIHGSRNPNGPWWFGDDRVEVAIAPAIL